MNEFTIEEIKMKINNLLWQVLPGKTTLDEAERIACQWIQKLEQVVGEIEK